MTSHAERELILDIARCPLVEVALRDPTHPCHQVTSVQTVPSDARQVPEAWAGRMSTARILFLSSNPSISMASAGADPRSAEAYPMNSDSDDSIVDFMSRRFDQSVEPSPYVRGRHHLQIDGNYAPKTTAFWNSTRLRAAELVGHAADSDRDYLLTEVVHCKSKGEEGVARAAETCATRYLDRVLSMSSAEVIVVMGTKAHERVSRRLDLPLPPYVVDREMAGKARLVAFLWHPSGFKGPKTFAGLYGPGDMARLRAAVTKTGDARDQH